MKRINREEFWEQAKVGEGGSSESIFTAGMTCEHLSRTSKDFSAHSSVFFSTQREEELRKEEEKKKAAEERQRYEEERMELERLEQENREKRYRERERQIEEHR